MHLTEEPFFIGSHFGCKNKRCFADVRILLVLAELCKHDHGNICLYWATFGKQFCPSGASIVPILNPNRSLGLARILYF